MGRHNRSEEAFFDFIPNKNFSCLNRRGGSRVPSEPPLDPPLGLAYYSIDHPVVTSLRGDCSNTDSIHKLYCR